MPTDAGEAIRAAIVTILGCLAIAVGVAQCSSVVPRALATWKPEYGTNSPEVQSWFARQHNSRGEWCCNETDGHAYFGDYTIHEDGSVTVERNGAPHLIPAYMVLKGPNPTGNAVWWFLDVGSTHSDYCFAPGTLG